MECPICRSDDVVRTEIQWGRGHSTTSAVFTAVGDAVTAFQRAG